MHETNGMSDVERWAKEGKQEVDAGEVLYSKNQYNGTHKTTDGNDKLVFKASGGGWWHYPGAGSSNGYTWYRRHNAQTSPSEVKR